MATEVMMPQVGQDIKTGVIIEWFKKENDPIQKGETIATVESDKATFEVEAYESGVLLKILHAAGAEVPVLTPRTRLLRKRYRFQSTVALRHRRRRVAWQRKRESIWRP